MSKKFQQFTAYLIVVSLLCLSSSDGFANYAVSIECLDHDRWTCKVASTATTGSTASFSREKSITKGQTWEIDRGNGSLGSLTITQNGELQFKASEGVDVTVKLISGSITATELLAAKVENYAELYLNLLGKNAMTADFENYGTANIVNTLDQKASLAQIQNEGGTLSFKRAISGC